MIQNMFSGHKANQELRIITGKNNSYKLLNPPLNYLSGKEKFSLKLEKLGMQSFPVRIMSKPLTHHGVLGLKIIYVD